MATVPVWLNMSLVEGLANEVPSLHTVLGSDELNETLNCLGDQDQVSVQAPMKVTKSQNKGQKLF